MASSSGKYNRTPTRDEIEAELALIWPGWTPTPMGEPRNRALPPGRLPEAWQRRVKWLLKWHSLIMRGLADNGWGVSLVADPRTAGHWFSHPVPGRGYQPEDEPAPVHGPPPSAGVAGSTARPSAAQVAVALRLPLGRVAALLADCPPDADPVEYVREVASASA